MQCFSPAQCSLQIVTAAMATLVRFSIVHQDNADAVRKFLLVNYKVSDAVAAGVVSVADDLEAAASRDESTDGPEAFTFTLLLSLNLFHGAVVAARRIGLDVEVCTHGDGAVCAFPDTVMHAQWCDVVAKLAAEEG